jgi:hypothetical protein
MTVQTFHVVVDIPGLGLVAGQYVTLIGEQLIASRIVTSEVGTVLVDEYSDSLRPAKSETKAARPRKLRVVR